ncbi:hypothetical protein [Kitasatospora sp. NPDC090091]
MTTPPPTGPPGSADVVLPRPISEQPPPPEPDPEPEQPTEPTDPPLEP